MSTVEDTSVKDKAREKEKPLSFDKSFFKFAGMDKLSDAAINRLTQYSIQYGHHGSELCSFFHKLVIYHQMQMQFEEEVINSTSQTDDTRREIEKKPVEVPDGHDKSVEAMDSIEENNEGYDESISDSGAVIDDDGMDRKIKHECISDEENEPQKGVSQSPISPNFDSRQDDRDMSQEYTSEQFIRHGNGIAYSSELPDPAPSSYRRSLSGTREYNPPMCSPNGEQVDSHLISSLTDALKRTKAQMLEKLREARRRRSQLTRAADPRSQEPAERSRRIQRWDTRNYESTETSYSPEASSFDWSRVGNLQIPIPSLMTIPPSHGITQPMLPNYNESRFEGNSGAPPQYSTFSHVSSSSDRRRDFCVFCQIFNHKSEKCRTFRTPRQREARRMELELCMHCLQQNCTRQHTRKRCSRCSSVYHSHPAFCASAVYQNRRFHH